MGRVDWIIQLRDLFYRLVPKDSASRKGKQASVVDSLKLLTLLIDEKDSLNLVSEDEY
jgi:hypothetical protein